MDISTETQLNRSAKLNRSERGFAGRRGVLACALGIAVALAMVLAGCGNDDGADSVVAGSGDTPSVVATTTIWADVVRNVTCDGLVDVITLIPPGGDPHSFQASLQDRGRMDDAAIVVANGLNLEELLEDDLEAVEEAGTPVFFVADHVETIEYVQVEAHEDDHDEEEDHDDHDDEDGHDHDADDDHAEEDGHDDDHEHEDDHDEDEHEHESEDEHDDHEDEDDHSHDDDEDDHAHEDDHDHAHDHTGDDPHIWFDPIRVADAILPLSGAIAAQTGLDADELNACAEEYRQELIAVGAEIEQILDPLPHEQRLLVTNHEALGYFADRHDFRLIGAVIPGGSLLAGVSASHLQELVDVIEETGVPAVFAENTHSTDDAEAVAQQAGVDVVVLNTGSLGEAGSGADTYIGFLRTTAQTIADSLS